jgi:2-haloacid dehalogenase
VVARMRWITFDCFGTLVDWHAGFGAALASVAGERAPDVLRAYHGHERVVERERPHRSYRDVLAAALERAAADCGVRVPDQSRHALADGWAGMRVFDDVEAMLAQLRAKGWRLGVLTNCDEDLFAVTHRTFARPFDLVLTAERVRGYKPARWHFSAFERLTRVERGEWVHVASSHYHDIAAAQALGIQYVWLDRERTGEEGVPPSAHVHSAPDVPDAIERLLAPAIGDRGPATPRVAPTTLACCT